MGSAASKSAASGAKSAARQFPSAANIAAQERAAAAAASAARAARESAAGGVGGDFERKERKEKLTSSPKLDYLAEQRKLEEQIAKYDEAIQKSKHHDGGSRPYEDTPSAAELEFFGNLKTVGQVQVHNPDQIKHHEAEQALKRKLPSKTPSSSSTTTSSSLPSSQQPHWTSATTESAATAAGATLTSLKLMQLLQARNQDPSVWTEARLAKEFDMRPEDIRAVTRYINTYTIVPGKDAKGRESGVWCEDLRGVTVVDKAKEAEAERRAAGLASKEEVASKEKKSSSKRS
ncbi:hypothetical protein BG006_010541 [Podila minutissima]|uniref:Uncharacterized protein n=1 Tax=Podila minutissima TaxID=64525 RepID=A0A9P5SQY7_9FUNG|nr:hypothetical protein BG006_010541 [Podila minutissima]